MSDEWSLREHLALGRYLLKWLAIAIPVGAVVGLSVALFLWLLDLATRARWKSDLPSGIPWLLFLLPLAGVGIAALYKYLGGAAEAGNDLIMDEIHEPGGGARVPARMAPLVLIATVLTHLFGGSAGREGTAVQMGGSMAGTAARWLRLSAVDRRTLLMAGVAAGFGAVFGTPLAGAIFAMEVLVVGHMDLRAAVPCLIAAVVGDRVAAMVGTHHTQYLISGTFAKVGLAPAPASFEWLLLAKVIVASVAFGLASVVFAKLSHLLRDAFRGAIRSPLLRPAVGGAIVIVLAFVIGPDYLGLGVVSDPNHPAQASIVNAFQPGGAGAWSWLWKIVFTAVTLSCGLKGGEVTPLFFIGATLGNALARAMGAPVDLFAGLGFVAVFAGATNTPLACTIMGIELFAGAAAATNGRLGASIGSGLVVYLAVACFVAYLVSGHSSVYRSQLRAKST